MFVVILTLAIYLTSALEDFNIIEDNLEQNSNLNTPYNIYAYVKELHLERCAIVGIGLKYYAIFLEDGVVNQKQTTVKTKYFLGICHQSTLEDWNFCSPALAKKRKNKCRFKVRKKNYVSRVHRRFCDISVMTRNKDCICQETVLGDEMHKVQGFPTCFIPPLPHSLCKYNVCGLAKCQATTIENRVHTIQCDQNCKGGKPFCENPLLQTAITPVVKSSWTKWKEVNAYVTNKNNRASRWAWEQEQKQSFAACINQFTGKGDVDCLGPGTGCCPSDMEDCECQVFEDRGGRKVERTITKKDQVHEPTDDNFAQVPLEPEGHSESADECGPPYCTGQPDVSEEEEDTNKELSKTVHNEQTSERNQEEQQSERAKTGSVDSEISGVKHSTEYSYFLILVVILLVSISK